MSYDALRKSTLLHTHIKNALIVCCDGNQNGWHTKAPPITSRKAHNTIIFDIPSLPSTYPSDFPASFLNPVMYSLMKYHH